MVSPVCGLRPVRADRSATVNLPKPPTDTSSPAATRAEMTSNVASTIDFASATETSACSATRPARSDLLMLGILLLLCFGARRRSGQWCTIHRSGRALVAPGPFDRTERTFASAARRGDRQLLQAPQRLGVAAPD